MADVFHDVDSLLNDPIFEGLDTTYYDLLNKLAVALVDYRMEHDLSQKQLGEVLGVTQAMVSKYESGDYNISMKAMCDLTRRLNIPFSIKIGEEALPVKQHSVYLPYTDMPVMQEQDQNIA